MTDGTDRELRHNVRQNWTRNRTGVELQREALCYGRQGCELKFSLRITPYRETRAVNVALVPGDRLSTARSNSTYFG